MAAVSAVSAVAERLDYLLLAEGALARCQGDLETEVKQLQSELRELREIVLTADSIDNMSEDLKKKVRQLAYDIEDAVESYARQEEEHQRKSFRSRFNWSGITERRLREDIPNFRSRIQEIKRREHHKGGGGGRGRSSSRIPSLPEAPQHPGNQLVPDETIPHMEEDIVSLKSPLLGAPSQLSVIAICGMNGIGKTTLARSLFDAPWVANRFDSRAWAWVSENFQARNVLKDILSFTKAMRIDKIAGMETMELMERLYKVLKGKRYLVVLDDVWSAEVWDTLKVAFPNDYNGSRIVITTRLMDGAKFSATYTHTMRLLSDQDSWELLKKKLKDRGIFPF